MGMTIEKAIAKIWHCIVSIRDCTGNKEFVEALILSVETMRKYQEIQEIIDDYEGEGWERIAVGKIREVMDDGNVD